MRVTNGVLNLRHWPFAPFDAGGSSPVARQAHNLKAAGSNPAPATKLSPLDQSFSSRLAGFFIAYDHFPARTTCFIVKPMSYMFFTARYHAVQKPPWHKNGTKPHKSTPPRWQHNL